MRRARAHLVTTRIPSRSRDRCLHSSILLHARAAVFPELILKEISKGLPKENTKSGKGLSIEARELLFNLLGNRSRDVVSLSDGELCKLVGEMLLGYR
jgi:hypothetical protein